MNDNRTRSHTVEDWVDALRRCGWQGFRVGKEWKGPCPVCGGTDRFHIGPGTKGAAVLVFCRHCTPESALQRAEWLKELVQRLFPRDRTWQSRRYGPRAHTVWPHTANARRASRGTAAPRPQGAARAAGERTGRSERLVGASNGATGGERASGAAVGCPACGGSSESDLQTGKRKQCGTCRARRMWEDARPVSTDSDAPARRWTALRNLWRPGDHFPASLRWLAWRDGGGSLVACFATLVDWQSGNPEPTGVQLIHIAPDGQPRRDRGGLGKRSHGTMGGSVVLMGDPLSEAGRIHVVEGVADALAVAAREDGAVIAAGGTSGFARLPQDVSRLGVPVVIWADGDLGGRRAAQRLAHALRERCVVASLAKVPDGLDPAEMAGSFKTEGL